MKNTHLVYFLLSFAMTAFAFAQTPSKDFSCEVEPVARKQFGELVGNAGCFVLDKQKLLVVQVIHNGRGLDIPGGTSEKGESAQCTAARETLEETGLTVVVHELAHTFGKFYLFRCELKDPSQADLVGTPKDFQLEIAKAFWLDVFQSDEKQWRFPKQLRVLKGMVHYTQD